MSDAKPKKAKGKKDKDEKAKGKKKDKNTGEGTSVANSPRARGGVRRARAWGGLAGFAIAGLLSLKAGVPTATIGLRALAAGFAGYLVAWACAVTVWRHILLAEVHALIDEALRERDEKEASTTPSPNPPLSPSN